MKVCFFINSLESSAGSERMTVLLANHLADNGHDVDIITQQGGEKSFFELKRKINRHYLFKQNGINIYTSYAKGLLKYKRLIRQLKPDYIIDVCVAMSLLTLPATMFNRKIKVISWEHFNANSYFNIATALLSKWFASKFAKGIVVLTETDKEVYKKKFKPKNIYVIKNPITIHANGKADITKKFVLAIGRLTEQKGFDMLLSAWKKIEGEATGWTLRIVGSGELDSQLKSQCSKLGIDASVEFVQPTASIGTYYLNSSIFVMSSRFEGLPLVLIEAKAFGLPIVSFDCETGPREVIRDGIDGILVPPNDVGRLATEMLGLINNPAKRAEFGKSAPENIGEFSQAAFFMAWENLLLAN